MNPVPEPSRVRESAWLVGPLVTLAAVAALIVAARFYDRLPVHPPECGFRAKTGIPCVGCGGTRSTRALSEGRIGEALRLNPAVVFGVGTTLVWTGLGCSRFLRRAPLPSVPEQNRRLRRNALFAALLLLVNWFYLVFFLP